MTGPTTIISAATHSDYGPEAQDTSQGQQGQSADHHDARAAAAQEADGVGWETDRRAPGMVGGHDVGRGEEDLSLIHI